MIVPQYWAEAKIKQRIKGRQVTIRRFGWSDVSETAAQQHADNRVAEAMALFESGKKINRYEPKLAYNGAEGVPIREEILARHNDCVITRNSYGARCLNSPDVLFADVDFESAPGLGLYLFSFLLLGAFLALPVFIFPSLIPAIFETGCSLNVTELFGIGIAIFFIMMIGTHLIASLVFKILTSLSGGVQKSAKNRIRKFVRHNPDWHLRIYRTPAGYRILAMHKTFDSSADETERFFKALKSDQLYMLMCKKQHCFRARLSPKPWRMGMDAHLKPRPGVWPINPERMADRINWIENYEKLARNYAACHFEEKIGSDLLNPKAEYARALHDKYCNAQTNFTMA